MKAKVELYWAFSDGDRWVLLASSDLDTPKAIEELERIAELETLKPHWGNYSFGVRVSKLDEAGKMRVYSEFEV